MARGKAANGANPASFCLWECRARPHAACPRVRQPTTSLKTRDAQAAGCGPPGPRRAGVDRARPCLDARAGECGPPRAMAGTGSAGGYDRSRCPTCMCSALLLPTSYSLTPYPTRPRH